MKSDASLAETVESRHSSDTATDSVCCGDTDELSTAAGAGGGGVGEGLIASGKTGNEGMTGSKSAGGAGEDSATIGAANATGAAASETSSDEDGGGGGALATATVGSGYSGGSEGIIKGSGADKWKDSFVVISLYRRHKPLPVVLRRDGLTDRRTIEEDRQFENLTRW